jgi:aryl-alcohol dehydrogenase (NADP+)
LLTGKYRRGQPAPADSRAAEKPDWMWKTDEALFDRLESLEFLAAEAGTSMSRFALTWALAQPAMSSLIVGVKHREQLEDAVAAAEVRLSPELLQKVDTVCPPPWRQPDPLRG